jgi:predicted transcriptional regulator
MALATEYLFGRTAADLMSAPLILIPEEMSLKNAAHRLAEAGVTGAPVVNSEGCCIGVLSATDFVHWMDREHHGPAACAASPAFSAPWEIVEPDKLPDATVRDFMTQRPVAVAGTATLGELARKMLDFHIHRLIVMDKYGKPIGVVSTTDIIAAVVQAHQSHATAINAGKVGA